MHGIMPAMPGDPRERAVLADCGGPKQRGLRVRAFFPQLLSAWLRDCASVRWRGCLRLPLCLADSTFVVDNIRCQHSPPVAIHVAM